MSLAGFERLIIKSLCTFLCIGMLDYTKNTGAWKVKLFGIFQNPKPKEVAKTYTNIICTYLKNVYFY